MGNRIRDLPLTDKEERLIEYIRDVPYGEILVITHDGEPVRVETTEKKKL